MRGVVNATIVCKCMYDEHLSSSHQHLMTEAPEVEPGIPVLHDGAPVAEMVLSSDTDGDATVLTFGSLSLHLIDRSGRVAVRVRDRESRTLKHFAGLHWYPFDLNWRREARFQPFSTPKTIPVPNFIGEPLEREGCPAWDLCDE